MRNSSRVRFWIIISVYRTPATCKSISFLFLHDRSRSRSRPRVKIITRYIEWTVLNGDQKVSVIGIVIRTIKLLVIISSRSFISFLSFSFFFPLIPRTSERDFALAMLFSLYSYSIISERAKSASVAFDRFDGKIERRLDERACEFRTGRPLQNSNGTWNSSLDGGSPSKRLFHSDFLECRELYKLVPLLFRF